MKDSRHRYTWPVIIILAFAWSSFTPGIHAQDEDPVVVTVDVSGNPLVGRKVRVTARVEINDGSTIQSYAWTQTGGVTAKITGASRRNAAVKLGDRRRYREKMLELIDEPAIGPAELPPNVPPPPEEFPAGLQDRFYLPGINSLTLEDTGLVTLEVAVTTTSGTYHGEAEIHTVLPWKRAGGIRNVAIGNPVLLHGKDQSSYDWTLTVPSGSNARLAGRGSANPEFTPDVPGIYEVQVTDQAAGALVTLTIYAGTWRGVVLSQDADGRPLPEGLCTACHNDSIAPDKFTPWAQTGHAEIFTQNINSSRFWGPQCFGCHTVGFDPDVDNGGVDEAEDYQAFLDSGLIGNPSPDNWTTVLEEYPATAQLANAQCENCHGPQNTQPRIDGLAHGARLEGADEPRVSLSSEVCAFCHGEPLRHARYQQWQLSRHSNYDLAIDRASSGSCSRCHTVNGFLKWLPVLLGDEPGDPTASVTVDWAPDEAHPQTCATCHDPHATGTTSGSDPNARVRISGQTPTLIAGFKVVGAGKAAICMTCHNSRRGLYNDSTYADLVAEGDETRAPHGSAQTDVLMGENAFMVNTGVRGPHSFIEDACVTCHMEKTPPPDALSYNQGGTNHTFFASPDICSECHEEIINAETVQGVVEEIMHDVQDRIEAAIIELMVEQIDGGASIDLDGDATITHPSQIADVELTEARGRQAIIVTLASGGSVGPVSVNSIDVIQPAPLPAVPLYDLADEGLIKAGWNWGLIHNDGSRGVHNPTYALTVLDAARDAVGGGAGGPRARFPF